MLVPIAKVEPSALRSTDQLCVCSKFKAATKGEMDLAGNHSTLSIHDSHPNPFKSVELFKPTSLKIQALTVSFQKYTSTKFEDDPIARTVASSDKTIDRDGQIDLPVSYSV